jgi:ribosomal protein S18 acetylase RimI-like enzyme
MTVSIRKARLEDAAGIAHVHVDSWRTTYKGLVPDAYLAGLSEERSLQRWQGYLEQPDSFLFVSESSPGNINGFIAAGENRLAGSEYKGEIHAIYLVQSAQRKGAGRMLFFNAVETLCSRRIFSMLLWVLKENFPSRKFYEAMGGIYLFEQPILIGGQQLIEVAYGWKDLTALEFGKE